jgi:hypothetical protein
MPLNLQQSVKKQARSSSSLRNMLQYVYRQLLSCCFKIMQSAAVVIILMGTVQATITVKLRITQIAAQTSVSRSQGSRR